MASPTEDELQSRRPEYLDTVGVTGSNPVSRTTVSTDLQRVVSFIKSPANALSQFLCHIFLATAAPQARVEAFLSTARYETASSQDCHDPWVAVPAAAERRSEFGYDGHRGLIRTTKEVTARNSKTLLPVLLLFSL
jgi:hypothetical protein